MLQSVWPFESNLQKSNQYVNSVISVRTVTTPFTQKSQPLLHSTGPHRISGMKHKYSTARGKSNRLSSSYIFSAAIHRKCQTPPLSLSDNQLWKYFSNVKCPNASEAMQAVPSGSQIRAGVCTLPVLTHRPPWIPLAAFQLQQDGKVSPSVSLLDTSQTYLL